VPERGDGAVLAADDGHREIGDITLALEVCCGPAFGLRVGLADGPIATAPAD
jgi:hypothetical protein